MTRLDLARKILRATCASTGETYDERAAARLAERNTVADLETMLTQAEALPPAGEAARSTDAPIEEAPGIVLAWPLRPWIVEGGRVMLPALEPGESAEAPEGVPAARGRVVAIDAAAGTVIVLVDQSDEGGTAHEEVVPAEDVEAEVLTPPAPEVPEVERARRVRRLEEKLRLARRRLAREQARVTKLEAELAKARTSATTAHGR